MSSPKADKRNPEQRYAKLNLLRTTDSANSRAFETGKDLPESSLHLMGTLLNTCFLIGPSKISRRRTADAANRREFDNTKSMEKSPFEFAKFIYSGTEETKKQRTQMQDTKQQLFPYPGIRHYAIGAFAQRKNLSRPPPARRIALSHVLYVSFQTPDSYRTTTIFPISPNPYTPAANITTNTRLHYISKSGKRRRQRALIRSCTNTERHQ